MATGRGVPRGEGGSGRSHRHQPCTGCGTELDRAWRFCPRCGEPAPVLRPGDTIDGRYEVVELLNRHEAREVYAARHLHLDEIRVLKILQGELFDDDSQLFRFRQEARLASKLRHPNVATLHDFSSLGNKTFYTAWEYLEGETARDRLQREGKLPVLDAIDAGIQAANGLSAIHEAGIVHRNISPENLMLSPAIAASREGARIRARIIDFGIATALAADDSEEALRRGFVNARYAAPEQQAGGAGVDQRTDIYALGLTLFELLTGRPPFDAVSDEEYARQQRESRPLSLRALIPEVPDMLEAVVEQALSRDPEQRFASAAEFRQALIRARGQIDPGAPALEDAELPPRADAGTGNEPFEDMPQHTEADRPGEQGDLPGLSVPAASMGVSIVFADEEATPPAKDSPLSRELTRSPSDPPPDNISSVPFERAGADADFYESPLKRDVPGERVPQSTVPPTTHPFLMVSGDPRTAGADTAPESARQPVDAAAAPAEARREAKPRREFDPLRSRTLPVPVIVIIVAIVILGILALALSRRSGERDPAGEGVLAPIPVQESPAADSPPPVPTETIAPLLPPNVSGAPEGAAADSMVIRELEEAPAQPGTPPRVMPAPPAGETTERQPAAGQGLQTQTAPPTQAGSESRQRITASEATQTLLTRVRRMDYYDARPDCLRAGAVQYLNEGYTVEIRTRACPGGVPENTLLGSWRVDAYTGDIFVRNERGRYVEP